MISRNREVHRAARDERSVRVERALVCGMQRRTLCARHDSCYARSASARGYVEVRRSASRGAHFALALLRYTSWRMSDSLRPDVDADRDGHAGSRAVTDLLAQAQRGDRSATDELFPLVYAELRRLADRHLSREPAGQTLQATALVHEAYLRLCGDADRGWDSRAHFFGAAARAIRRILIDRARSRRRLRRGGGARAEPFDPGERAIEIAASVGAPHIDFLALDEALERLAAIDPQAAKIVELRFFGGLSPHDTARALRISESTEARGWRFARVWLHRELFDDSLP